MKTAEQEQSRPLAWSPEAFARAIHRGRSFVFAHIRQGNIKVVQMGDGKRIPDDEAQRIAREGLPPLTKKQPA